MKLYQIIETATGTPVGELLAKEQPTLLSDTHHVEAVAEQDMSLEDLQAFYIDVVDRFAGDVRNRFVSSGHGIELTYAYKSQEAQAFAAAGYVGGEADFPFIFREATATDSTPQEVADRILARIAALRDVGSTLEAQRLRAHKQISEAVDEASAKEAKDFALASLSVHGG